MNSQAQKAWLERAATQIKKEQENPKLFRKAIGVPYNLRGVGKDAYGLFEINLEGASGVYFMCGGEYDEIIYIGSSENVPRRIAEHVKLRLMFWSRVFFLPVKKANERLAVEVAMIKKFKPLLNITHSPACRKARAQRSAVESYK